ncbi:type II secretion system secretin GspD [Peristeroidobacter soli]|jgi:general secretion pathway protein D|uniref:type II secretion system secretin GspD n=1 Tax=Peristeroidobacter soli TaxID=2497877 RepID=UPI001300A7D5|nr:type II secretion system secretin GspD [Peristeroidobacter soli]
MTISSTNPAAGKPQRVLSGNRSGLLALTLTCLLTCMSATAQQPPQPNAQQSTITPNFIDAQLTDIIDAVATITGKTFIVDPRVRAQVTIRSSTPMTPDAFYQTFLSILQVHGFIAVPSGENIKVLPDANARQIPGNDLPNSINPNSDEVVTQVISVRNINAAQLVPVLRPLIPQNGHLVAYPASNMLIVSDRANNIARIMRIVQRLDQAGDEEIEIIRLDNASASEIVRVVNALSQGAQQQGEAPGLQAKLVADDRTNSVLISGEKSQRLRLKGLVMHLDTPLEAGGDTQVRYLNYADAEQIAGKLKEQVTGITQAAPGAPGAGATASPTAAADRNTTIWADKQTNALVVTAAPKMMRQIMGVVDKLDIRRAQVHLEAILVEITQSRAAELGVNWAVYSEEQGSTIPIGTFNQPVGGTSLGSLASAIINPDTATTASLPTGLTLGAGMIKDGGLNFAVLLRALRNDGSSNILQTPSITTLDNEEAEIKVAQEVPFITGQYTNTGTTNQGSVNPFQTIQREEVGNILKITPQINEGTAVQLKIEQENSNLTQGVTGAVDLITNKRTISTTVLVEDGGMIVLGGLITESANEGESRVPILGNIPIIGELFKTRNGTKEKRNLMVFIRPTILRDGVQAAITTSAKYNVLRDQQLQRGNRKGKVTLLPGEKQPLLPPIEELSKYADPTAGAQAPAPGTNPEAPPPAQTQPLPEQTPPPKQ